MIDMDRIEKSYLRLKLLCDSLLFRIREVTSEGKDQHGKDISTQKEPYWEVTCNARYICKEDTKEKATAVADELNNILKPFIEKHYTKFLDEVIVSKTKIENSN